MKIQNVKFMLMAADMDRAVAFWRDGVGLGVGMLSPYWSELLFGDAIIALHGGGDGSLNDTGLGFQVEDIDVGTAHLVAAGATVRTPPQERPGEPIKLAELTDPEGNGFKLSQYIGDSHPTD